MLHLSFCNWLISLSVSNVLQVVHVITYDRTGEGTHFEVCKGPA